VSVLCTSKKSYEKWKLIEKIFVGEGVSKRLFNVNIANPDQVKEFSVEENVHYIISDGDWSDLEPIQTTLRKSKDGPFYRPVFTSLEAPNPTDLNAYLDSFTLVRSMAVNTMRHGAPLDLGF
jgi:RHH-type proline utilization regulon transcriptional repressor/proline dehydrogenase/delta 1-pyrroline-5-carboxylate dehydrogenase